MYAHVGAADTVEAWIQTYEAERAQFASFAVFTELKLDEVRDSYVRLVGRPNAIEAAACCATLLKMPGIVGCYKSLLEKVAVGIESAVFLPSSSSLSASASMSTLVRSMYARQPYFERVHELERQLFANRSVSDANVLKKLSVEEVARVLQLVPFPRLRSALKGINTSTSVQSRELLDRLLRLLIRLHEQQQRLQRQQQRQHDEDEDESGYPMRVPLVSSAQICRAIAHHAASFSASGRYMVLCSILEFVDAESFRDVYKRFDTKAKTSFLHHLSVNETSEHLQLIAEALPNAGDTVFRLYAATCTGDPLAAKHAFFQKLLGPETEFFFLCDLAAYLTEEQWQLLSKEFEKNLTERRNKRRGRRKRRSAITGDEFFLSDGDDGFDIDNSEDEDESGSPPQSASASRLEQFQLMLWNFIHRHRLTGPQLLPVCVATFLLSFEETEMLAMVRTTAERSPIDARWRQFLAVLDEIESGNSASPSSNSTNSSRATADPSTTTAPVTISSEGYVQIYSMRMQVLKKLFAMLSREERDEWLDKMNAKHPTESYKRKSLMLQQLQQQQSSSRAVTSTATTTSPSVSLDDPTPHVPRMNMDAKMRWMEALLAFIANDREYSARVAMLRQVLQPFMDGKTQQAASSPAKPAISLPNAEKSVAQILQQLVAADRAKLLLKLAAQARENAPPSVDRASSPIAEMMMTSDDQQSASSHAPRPSAEVIEAVSALIAQKSERFALQLLRNGLSASGTGAADASSGAEAGVEGSGSSGRGIGDGMRRKLSAVVAVAEPMEWQENVKLGCLDVGCQTVWDGESEASSASASASSSSPAKSPTKAAALTLSALIGAKATGAGGKRKDKYQKVNSAAVLKPVASLITSWRMNTDQLVQFAKKSLPNVLRIIADAYSELLTAGRRRGANPSSMAADAARSTSRGGRERELSLSQIVYQSFLHSYGLPAIADLHLLAFSCALETYRSQHLRVELFARFCFEEVAKQELANYSELLESIVCDDVSASGPSGGNTGNTSAASNSVNTGGGVASKRAARGFVPRIAVPDKENWAIPLDKAQKAVQLCFRAMRKHDVAAFCDKLAVIASQGTSSAVPSAVTVELRTPSPANGAGAATNGSSAASDALALNVDHLLVLAVLEWQAEQQRRESYLLDAFRAGDVNGDGQLTAAEFSQIVLSIDRSRELGDLLLMYSDTLRRTQCDTINTDVFLQVARDYELDRAVWSDDGDLRNIVNDAADLETTWARVRGFFLGTLEALARDLPATHFLRVCEGAGCGCLNCILDSYIGFQKMRRDLRSQEAAAMSRDARDGANRYGVSPALAWARFWHLMRQLYDASAESDGIVTPWEPMEGECIARTSPAPPLSLRFNSARRDALPIFLFPDTQRISGVMRDVHDPEAFAAAAIRELFADALLGQMSYRTAGNASGGG